MHETSCPTDDDFEALVTGTLDDEDRARLESHVEECVGCAQRLDTAWKGCRLLVDVDSIHVVPVNDKERKAIERGRQLLVDTSTDSFEETIGVDGSEIDNGHSGGPLTEDPKTNQTLDMALFDRLGPAEGPDELARFAGYRVLRLIGRGGMGSVFEAEDLELRRAVALKVLNSELATVPKARERFVVEARATAAIEHDNIVDIYQVGEFNGIPFLAMPFLQGESLQDRLDCDGNLPVAECLRIGREVASGLAAAHARGLIHRDIKPDNIWIQAETGRVKILDFGLVRGGESDATLTQVGQVLGTPKYMSPEQANGDVVCERSDLFSLGVVLYRAITGEDAFAGRSITKVLMSVAACEYRPVDELMPEVDPAVTDVVHRLLSQRVADRPESANEVIRIIVDIERSAIRVTVDDSPGDGSGRRPRERSTTGPFFWGGLIALLFAIGLLGWWGYQQRPGTVLVRLPDGATANRVYVDDSLIQHAVDPVTGLVTLRVPPGEHGIFIETANGDRLTTNVDEPKFSLDPGASISLAVIEVISKRAVVQPPASAVIDKRSAADKGADPTTSNADAPTTGSTQAMTPSVVEPEPGTASQPRPSSDDGSRPLRTDLTPWAGLVDRPRPIDGVRFWNVETRRPRTRIVAATVSPNGRLLATVDEPGAVRVYEAASGRLIALRPSFEGYGETSSVDWLDEDRFVVVRKGERIDQFIVFSCTGGDVLSQPMTGGEREYVDSIAVNDQTSRVACGSEKGVIHIRDESGALLRTFDDPRASGVVHDRLSWNHDGTKLASGHEGNVVRVWTAEGELVEEFTGDMAIGLAWLWDGDSLVMGSAETTTGLTIVSLDEPRQGGVPSKKQVSLFEDSPVREFYVYGRTLVASNHRSDAVRGTLTVDGLQQRENLPVKMDLVFSLTANGAVVFGDGDGYGSRNVRIYEPDRKIEEARGDKSDGEDVIVALATNWAGSASVSRDGRYIATNTGSLHIWSTAGQHLASYDVGLNEYLNEYSTTAWSPDGQRVASSAERIKGVSVIDFGDPFDVENGFVSAPLNDSQKALDISALTWNSSGTLFTGTCARSTNSIDLYDPSGHVSHSITCPEQALHAAFHPTEDLLAVVTVGGVWTTSAASGWELVEAYRFEDATKDFRRHVVWSPEGDRLAVGHSAICDYRNEGLTPRQSIMPLWTGDWIPNSHFAFDFLANERRPLLDLGSAKSIREPPGTGEKTAVSVRITSAGIHPDGNTVYSTASDGRLYAWDLATFLVDWHAYVIDEAAITLAADGQILFGDRQAIDKELVFYVDRNDGQAELLDASSFNKLFGGDLFAETGE